MVYVSQGNGVHAIALGCSWQPAAPGRGSIGLDNLIGEGVHTVSVFVYDQQVTGFSTLFTGGKWTYDISLTDKDGTLWRGTGYGATTSPGVVFARQFVVERGRDGVLKIHPGTSKYSAKTMGELTSDQISMMFLADGSIDWLVTQIEEMVDKHGLTGSDFFYAPNDYADEGNCY
jgi:hypothetical protein